MRIKILLLILLIYPFLLSAQDSNENDKEEKKIEKSIKQQREEKLLYGINTEILELLDSLKEEKNPDFNMRLKDILKETKNRKIM